MSISGNGRRVVLVSIALIAAAVLASVLTPRGPLPHTSIPRELDAVIPRHFGGWTYLPNVILIIPDAEDRAASRRLYTQVIARGYSDASGHVVMLLVAYGPAQDSHLRAHRPELCYTAAGFRVLHRFDADVIYREGLRPIKLTRLTTVRESRVEPVSYWMRVGDTVSRSAVDLRVVGLEYGLHGIVPDGALIRISSVGMAEDESFKLHDQFIRDLIDAVQPADRAFFTGKSSKSS